jgi:ABC-2 type transport system ATP-binding protein
MSIASKPAIIVEEVSKNFFLPHEKVTSLKSKIVGVFKRKDRTVETQHALKKVSFEVKEGEFFGILGRNGSGKSTLLKILAEIYQPTKGKVSVDGKLVPFIELGVGFNPELTGRENVYLNGALLGFSSKEIDAKYDDIVSFAELEDFMDQKLKNYSSGMQVRLAFSVATRAEAEILLVDEVLAVGDADFQRKCYEYFKSLKKQGKTVVFVTHDMNAVREYCDRAILINNSQLVFEGSAADAANEYLKLFNKNADESQAESLVENWGTKDISITDKTISLEKDRITVNLHLATKKNDVNDFVVGFRFIDKDGRVVAGVNNINSVEGNKQPLSLKANSKMKVSFSTQNILGSGSYDVGLTLRSKDGVTIYDNWERAKEVKQTRIDGSYPVILPARVDVEL